MGSCRNRIVWETTDEEGNVMKVVGTRRKHRISKFVAWLVLLVLLCGVVGVAVVRTEWFREIAEKRAGKLIGLDVKIQRTLVGWPYDLVFQGVSAGELEQQGFVLKEVRVGRSLRRWTVEVHGGTIRMAPDKPGGGALARLTGVRHAGALDIMRLLEPVRDRMALRVRNLDLVWLGDTGEDGLVPGMALDMLPAKLPNEMMTYFRLRIVGQCRGAFGDARDLRWEWLSRDGADYIELFREARYGQDEVDMAEEREAIDAQPEATPAPVVPTESVVPAMPIDVIELTPEEG